MHARTHKQTKLAVTKTHILNSAQKRHQQTLSKLFIYSIKKKELQVMILTAVEGQRESFSNHQLHKSPSLIPPSLSSQFSNDFTILFSIGCY